MSPATHRLAVTFVSTLFAALLPAQEDTPKQEPEAAKPPASAAEVLAAYHPQEGTVKVGTVAEVKLTPGWVWLDGADARRFLVDCGNPENPSTLGVAMPPDFAESHVFAVYAYADEGHVDDSEEPDYDTLLADMKKSTAEESEQRRNANQPTVQLLGWAEPPHYDKAQHKMYWAERLKFEGNESDTLNYNVRVLGRTGYLVVSGVGDVAQLPLVAAHNKALLEATDFVEGQRYADFQPDYDKVAAYGIGGLVAGKLAMKAGLFALLLKNVKLLVVGVLVGGAALLKVLRGKKKNDAPAQA